LCGQLIPGYLKLGLLALDRRHHRIHIQVRFEHRLGDLLPKQQLADCVVGAGAARSLRFSRKPMWDLEIDVKREMTTQEIIDNDRCDNCDSLIENDNSCDIIEVGEGQL
jgi:hypothetical protein